MTEPPASQPSLRDVNPQSVTHLQETVVNQLSSLQYNHLGKLLLNVCVTDRSSDRLNSPMIFSVQDICQIMKREGDLWESKKGKRGKQAYDYKRIHLDPKFQVNKVNKEILKEAFKKEAVNHGEHLVCNGGARELKAINKDSVLELRCRCSDFYRGHKVNPDTNCLKIPDDLRKTSLVNNGANNRHGKKGKQGPRQTSTWKALHKQQPRCPFSILIYQGPRGYFIQAWCGNPFHSFHFPSKVMSMPTDLLPEADQHFINDIAGIGKAASGIARNSYYSRSKRMGRPTLLSLQQVHHIMKKLGPTDNPRAPKEGPACDSGNIDRLYSFLEEEGASYISLLQKRDGSQNREWSIFNEVCTPERGVEETIISPEAEPTMYEQADHHRKLRRVTRNQQMMIGIAWVLPFEIRQFRLFHAVIHIDATAKTNKEERPLITVTSKDSRNRMFTVLRAFVPSEQSWAYHWLFQTVFPSLFGKRLLSKVCGVVTNEDSQEIGQLESAMHKFCPRARRIRCSWHIIDRGWNNHLSHIHLGGDKKKQKDGMDGSN